MTTAITTPHAPSAAGATVRPTARLTFANILHSEWIKLTSLRSTVWSLALIVVLGIGLSLMITVLNSTIDVMAESSPSIVLTTTTIGIAFGQLIAAVLGVLVISGEYSTGMIRSTLAAVPSRLAVLAAKAVVLFVLVTTAGLLTMFGSWAATYPVLENQGNAVGLGDEGFAVALVGAALYLGLTAVFALGLGTLLRSAAGGIAAALGVVLILNTVVPVIGFAVEWVSDISPYLFSNAGVAMAQLPSADGNSLETVGLLEPGWGALVVVAWTLVSLILGAIRLQKQDA